MAFSKLYDTPDAAVADLWDGATILIGGAASRTEPKGLLAALLRHHATNLTVVGDFSQLDGRGAMLEMLRSGRVERVITPFEVAADDGNDSMMLELSGVEQVAVPQGTLAERLRAAGAGIGGIFVPVGLGTRFAEGKETRSINGVECVFESPLRADFALIRGYATDHLGNLVYSGAQRGWNAVMATAARITIVEADTVGEPGTIDPELVVTPGIYVNRIVEARSAVVS